MTDKIAHPQYHLLPWETQEAEKLAKEATDYNYQLSCSYGKGWTDEYYQHKLNNAINGQKAEIAFYEMIADVDKESTIWTTKHGDYNADYDFDIPNRFGTIDVKCTEISDKVKTPQDCNFVTNNQVVENFIGVSTYKKLMPNYFVQFFIDNDVLTYVGAFSGFFLSQFVNGDKPWHYASNGILLLNRKTFDATDIFLLYFKHNSQLNMTEPVF